MSELRERIEARLRERLAALCEGGAGEAKGDLAQQADPLFRHLDELIRVVEQIKDYSIEPYREMVKKVVCSDCYMDPEGSCPYRSSVGCALDAYFPIIVAIIEKELEADPGLP